MHLLEELGMTPNDATSSFVDSATLAVKPLGEYHGYGRNSSPGPTGAGIDKAAGVIGGLQTFVEVGTQIKNTVSDMPSVIPAQDALRSLNCPNPGAP